MPVADRAIKVADRLAEFLLGAPAGLAGIGEPPAARRFDVPKRVYGRTETIEEIARSLSAETRLPLVVCGPDRHAMLAAAVGMPLLLLDVGRMTQLGALADATIAAALEPALLCFDGLDALAPAERASLLELVEEPP